MATTAHTHTPKEGANAHARLAELIQTKQARIGVIGLGYVGLPLIRAFTAAGFAAWASTSIRRRSTS